MVAKGNGDPARCANNLLRIVRGEVAFERVKGLTPYAQDMPEGDARSELEQSARWNIETYEPRIETSEIKISKDGDAITGDYNVTAVVSAL